MELLSAEAWPPELDFNPTLSAEAWTPELDITPVLSAEAWPPELDFIPILSIVLQSISLAGKDESRQALAAWLASGESTGSSDMAVLVSARLHSVNSVRCRHPNDR